MDGAEGAARPGYCGERRGRKVDRRLRQAGNNDAGWRWNRDTGSLKTGSDGEIEHGLGFLAEVDGDELAVAVGDGWALQRL